MPSVASINFCANSKTNRPKEKKNFKGGFLAMGASTLTSLAFTPVSLLCGKGLTSPSKNLTLKEIKTLNDGASDILNKLTNLAQKGVTIEHVDAKDYIDLPIEGRFSSWIKDQIPINSAIKGKNAFFSSTTNQVVYNKNKLPLAAFHELGHAFNFNNSAFWKSMQKMRMPMMGIASIFTLIPAITKNHKAKEGEELTKKEKFVNVTVKNSGVEIGESEKEKIFNRFYRTEKTQGIEGTGVGLAIVKKIVDLHKGSVFVDSVNGYTTFEVVLPC